MIKLKIILWSMKDFFCLIFRMDIVIDWIESFKKIHGRIIRFSYFSFFISGGQDQKE